MTDTKLTNITKIDSKEHTEQIQQVESTVEIDLAKITHLKSILLANQLTLNPERIARAMLIFHTHTSTQPKHD